MLYNTDRSTKVPKLLELEMRTVAKIPLSYTLMGAFFYPEGNIIVNFCQLTGDMRRQFVHYKKHDKHLTEVNRSHILNNAVFEPLYFDNTGDPSLSLGFSNNTPPDPGFNDHLIYGVINAEFILTVDDASVIGKEKQKLTQFRMRLNPVRTAYFCINAKGVLTGTIILDDMTTINYDPTWEGLHQCLRTLGEKFAHREESIGEMFADLDNPKTLF